MSRRSWTLMVLITLATPLTSPAYGVDERIAPEAFRRVVQVLADRRIAPEGEWATGPRTRTPSALREVFRRTVASVPFVVSTNGTGSAVVVGIDPATSVGWVITNHHVVEQPFTTDKGVPYVLLMFYDPQLAAEPFEPERTTKCDTAAGQDAWCSVLRRSVHPGILVGTDPDRDLALLFVPDLPQGVQRIQEMSIDTVSPGDDVVVIGHPRGFLWTLTTGVVSGVRPGFPMGKARGTVIQTQTPISPGSSGGPLLSDTGRLLGVIAWGVFKDSQGLNGAIAINEVQAFTVDQANRFQKR